jgi:hypothetical protein
VVSQRDAETRHRAVTALCSVHSIVSVVPGWDLALDDPATADSVAPAAAAEEVEIDIDEFGNVVERPKAAPSDNKSKKIALPPRPDYLEVVSGATTPTFADLVLGVCLRSLRDYSTDNRGDVGSWVREAAMTALHKIILQLVEQGTVFFRFFVYQFEGCSQHACALVSDSPILTLGLCTIIMQALIKQLMEKINRVRQVAGTVFFALLHHPHLGSVIPNVDVLQQIFPAYTHYIWFPSLSLSLSFSLFLSVC